MKNKFKVQSSKPKVENRKPKTENRKPSAKDGQTNFAIRDPQPTVLFGVLPVLEALRAENRRIEKIIVAEGAKERRLFDILDLAQRKSIQFQKIPRENFSRFVEIGANHQGIVAFVAAASYVDADALLEEIYAKENALLVILDGVEDPRNLGAILRSVECSGADGVFIPERRAVGLTETVAKSSAGATEYVKVAKVASINRLIDELKEHNIWVVGASGEAEVNYTDWDWTQSSALVLGGEGKGLHRLTAEKCDALVKIPMRGKIESLNVSVAAGVMLFEAIKQRVQARKAQN
jgi:23S rRNA (guanosine2251-2'-O)-methyltransferase